jgi:cytochrome c biogenesis protein CcmG/thiol:disulfide interchange protein DsbE
VIALVPLIAVVVGALLFVSLHSHDTTNLMPPSATIKGRAVVGEPAPLFRVKDLDDNNVDLVAYRGRPLILAFGASWCHPCRQEYPLLVQAAAQHEGDVAIVSVMHDDLAPDSRNFMHEFHAGWPAIEDESNAISSAYGVVGIPQTFFITPAGVVQARVYGITSHAALDAPLRRLLASG